MDPYAKGMLTGSPYAGKRTVSGRVVAVLRVAMKDRGLMLIKPISRAVKVHEIHELITTEEALAAPGGEANDVSYVAFVEIERGGVLVVGDEVRIGPRSLGRIVGFDDTHMPNHQNILMRTGKAETGLELGIGLEEEVLFSEAGKEAAR